MSPVATSRAGTPATDERAVQLETNLVSRYTYPELQARIHRHLDKTTRGLGFTAPVSVGRMEHWLAALA
jgi:hypothetical protein